MTAFQQLRFSTYAYVGLCSTMFAWTAWLFVHSTQTAWIVWLVLSLPLLLPLPGVLKRKPKTMAAATYLVLFYVVHAIGEWMVVPEEASWAAAELLFALAYYLGTLFGLRKLKHAAATD